MFFGNVSRGKRGASNYVPPPPPPPLDVTDWTVVGTPVITHGADLATSVNATFPTVAGGVLAGDCIIAFCSSRTGRTIVKAPTGYRCPKFNVFYNGGAGTNVGTTQATTMFKECVGGESGAQNFQLMVSNPDPPPDTPNATLLSVMLMVIRKGTLQPGSPPAHWDIQVEVGTYRNWNEGVNLSLSTVCRSANPIHLKPKDQILLFRSCNSAAFTFTPRSISVNAGITMVTQTENLFQGANNNGHRQYIFGSHHRCTAGDISDFVSANATAVGTATTRAPYLICHFVRIRQSSEPMEYRPSRYDEIWPENMPNDNIGPEGGSREIMKLDFQVTGAIGNTPGVGGGATREVFNGITHFVTRLGFLNYSTEINRRVEEHMAVWQPAWEPGVKVFESRRVKWKNWPEFPYQFVFFQNHTGGWTGVSGPNSPIINFEFVKANQHQNIQGWMMGAGNYVPAGTMVISFTPMGIGNSNKYIAVPSINCIGTKDIPLEVYCKAGYAGQGRFVLASAGNILVDETTLPTIGDIPEDMGNGVIGSNTGSVADVMGIFKWFVYMHPIQEAAPAGYTNMQAMYNAFNNVGMIPEIKVFNRGIKRCVKHPTDWDYADSYDNQTLQKIII